MPRGSACARCHRDPRTLLGRPGQGKAHAASSTCRADGAPTTAGRRACPDHDGPSRAAAFWSPATIVAGRTACRDRQRESSAPGAAPGEARRRVGASLERDGRGVRGPHRVGGSGEQPTGPGDRDRCRPVIPGRGSRGSTGFGGHGRRGGVAGAGGHSGSSGPGGRGGVVPPRTRSRVSEAASPGDSAGRPPRAGPSRAGTRRTRGAARTRGRTWHQCTIRAARTQRRIG